MTSLQAICRRLPRGGARQGRARAVQAARTSCSTRGRRGGTYVGLLLDRDDGSPRGGDDGRDPRARARDDCRRPPARAPLDEQRLPACSVYITYRYRRIARMYSVARGVVVRVCSRELRFLLRALVSAPEIEIEPPTAYRTVANRYCIAAANWRDNGGRAHHHWDHEAFRR